MKQPCDEAVIRSGNAAKPAPPAAKPWILAATIIGSSMAFIDSTVVNVALPALQSGFHATVIDVQWVVEAYGLFLAALILVGGSLGDRLGRRKIFIIGVTVFAAASAACGLAPDIRLLIIARSVQGVGAALLVPSSLAIISASFDQANRGAAIGTWSGFTAITAAVGPVLGGFLVQHASWRWAFFINVPMAAVVIAITLWRLPESRGPADARLDWRGALAASAGLGGLVNGFVESPMLGWAHPLVWGSLVVGVLGLSAFAYIELHVASPMAPPGLFASRDFTGANLLTLFLYSAIGIFFFLFAMNLIQVHGYSATAAGGASLPMILMIFFLSRWAGGLIARYGPRIPLIAGPMIAGLGFALFALPAWGSSYWTQFFPAVAILGLGMAITVAPLTTVVMSSVTQDHAGAASGINNAVARVASVLAIAVLGMIMVNAFSLRLNHNLAGLTLAPGVLNDIRANEIKLAGLPIPEGLDQSAKADIEQSVRDAFGYGFRMVMGICAALAVAASGVARAMIRGQGRTQTSE